MTEEEMDADDIRQIHSIASQIRSRSNDESGDLVADALDAIGSILGRVAQRLANS